MGQISFDPSTIVIFGATGDLTKRKLIPSLYALFAKGELGQRHPIICVARKELSTFEFIATLESDKFIKNLRQDLWQKFIKQLHYYSFDFGNVLCGQCVGCEKCNLFNQFVSKIDLDYQTGGNALFYLATSPNFFNNISRVIEQSGFFKTSGWKRVAFEKPFGHDLQSARDLNDTLKQRFSEEQTYRIDHYLGKALVQEIMSLRFANAIFEQIWNNKFIEHIQISVCESVTIESRAGYYDNSGAIRDMLQNHLMQLLSLTLMEKPITMSAFDIKNAKIDAIRALRAPTSADVVLGQYQGYLQEPGVAIDSKTETFVAVRAFVDNERWSGVPVYMRTGKALRGSFAEINLVLKNVAAGMFSASDEQQILNNVITIRIQPDTGVALTFNSKKPGPKLEVSNAIMDFCHHCKYKDNTPEAYEALFASMIIGDQTMFPRWDGIELSWQYTDELKRVAAIQPVHIYQKGTDGPDFAEKLIAKSSYSWINNSYMSKLVELKDIKFNR